MSSKARPTEETIFPSSNPRAAMPTRARPSPVSPGRAQTGQASPRQKRESATCRWGPDGTVNGPIFGRLLRLPPETRRPRTQRATWRYTCAWLLPKDPKLTTDVKDRFPGASGTTELHKSVELLDEVL